MSVTDELPPDVVLWRRILDAGNDYLKMHRNDRIRALINFTRLELEAEIRERRLRDKASPDTEVEDRIFLENYRDEARRQWSKAVSFVVVPFTAKEVRRLFVWPTMIISGTIMIIAALSMGGTPLGFGVFVGAAIMAYEGLLIARWTRNSRER
jgi:hypothetical protein